MSEGIDPGWQKKVEKAFRKLLCRSQEPIMSTSLEWPQRTTTVFVCRECFPDRGGFLPHVIRLIDRYLDEFLDQRVLERACEGGADVSTLQFLLAFTAPDWWRVVKAAARGGHLHVLEWMWTINEVNCRPWRYDFSEAPSEAARFGHLDVLKWLSVNCAEHLSSNIMSRAAANSQLGVVQWLNEHLLETRSVRAIQAAAEHGHLEVVEWLHEHVPGSESNWALVDAARGGHLGVVQWLYQKKCNTHLDSALSMAVSGGHLHVVQWLYDHGSRPSDLTWILGDSAAASCNLELLKWLDELYPGQFTWRTMRNAALNGHLDVVKWLHGHGCDGSAHAMSSAAFSGHLAIVKWLHEYRQDECTTYAMDGAAREGHLDVVKWLHRHRSEGCTDRGTISAAFNGHLEIVRFLYDNNINRFLDEQGRHAADLGQLELLQVLVCKHGVYLDGPISIQSSIRACVEKMLNGVRSRKNTIPSQVPNGNHTLRRIINVMELLHNHHHHLCVSGMLSAALECGYPSLVESFFTPKSTDSYKEYLEASRGLNHRALIRWLLKKLSQIDIYSAIPMIRMDSWVVLDVEVMWWLSESDRTQVVCEAIREEWHGREVLLRWTFNRIAFRDAASQRAIQDAIRDAPENVTQWLIGNIENTEVLGWCLPTQRRQLAV